MNIGRCKGCGQPIVWIVTTKGKKMPCDPQPVTGYGDHTTVKKDKIVTGTGMVLSCNLKPDGGAVLGVGYVPQLGDLPGGSELQEGEKAMMPALALLWILGGTFIEAAITTLVVSWLIGESFQWSVTVLFWLILLCIKSALGWR